MKKTIAILSTLLLTCLVHMSAHDEIDFRDGPVPYISGQNGYIILRAKDGTLTDEVRLVGPGIDMVNSDVYTGGEDVPDEVTHDGKTYKVVEFGHFSSHQEFILRRLKFGKNMRRVSVNRRNFNLPDGIEVSAENKHLKSIDGILYSADCKTLLLCPLSLSNDYSPKVVSIPDEVEFISVNAFENCHYVVIDHLPKSLKRIGAYAFMGTKNMPEELVVPEGVTGIGNLALASSSIRKIILPSTLMIFGELPSKSNLECIVCLAPAVPFHTPRNFSPEWADDYNARQAVLLVPEESVELYRQDPYWGKLTNIYAYKDPTAIASVLSENNNASGVYFDLQGRRLSGKPSKGVYIENGKKRVVK